MKTYKPKVQSACVRRAGVRGLGPHGRNARAPRAEAPRHPRGLPEAAGELGGGPEEARPSDARHRHRFRGVPHVTEDRLRTPVEKKPL